MFGSLMFRPITIYSIIIFFILRTVSCTQEHINPPIPYGPTPSKAQLLWQKMEYYGFLHFGLNTFTNQEWGYGNVSPEKFNPINFDAEQIVSAAKEAGMSGLILTCKHHDGFCLWPSSYTAYSVKSSPWKNGKGDVVKEISDACAKLGLRFGVYLSPWDRNRADYGTSEYIEYYRNQLRELLSNYGSISEVWFDGANGGSGWYGGADEERKIDRSTYYDWENTWQIVRELQPEAVIFSDVGPDIRWVGNENGVAGDPCWATYTPTGKNGEAPAPGQVQYQQGQNGHRDGKYWMPAECDVSIRPGWFYHASEDSLVKSPEALLELYFNSVGRGASLLLNIPPDSIGHISEKDVNVLKQFRKIRNQIFKDNLATQSKITVSNTRGNSEDFSPLNLIDGERKTYWTTDDEIVNPELILEFNKLVVFNIVKLEEFTPLGQRVGSWAMDLWADNRWMEFATGTSIGNKRLWKGKMQTTSKVRFRILKAGACPAISELGLYLDSN